MSILQLREGKAIAAVYLHLRLYFIIYPWVLNLVQNNHMVYHRAVYCSHFLGTVGCSIESVQHVRAAAASMRIASAGQVSTKCGGGSRAQQHLGGKGLLFMLKF